MNAPFRIRRFDFDQVFDAGSMPFGDADLATLRRRVLELETELTGDDRDVAIDAARAAGFEAGLAQANGERQSALLAAADALHAAVEEVYTQLDRIEDEAALNAAEVARLAAGMIAARMIDQAPATAIDEAIGRVLRQVARGQEIQVTVHPTLAGELERLVAVRQSGDRRRLGITVCGDAACAFGDAHIHWDQGGMVLDAAARAAAVEAALAPVFALL